LAQAKKLTIDLVATVLFDFKNMKDDSSKV
jgi:hypothetical protein